MPFYELGIRPLIPDLKTKGRGTRCLSPAYHLLITDKHIGSSPGDEGAGEGNELTSIGTNTIGGTDWVRTSGLALMKRLS